MSATTVYTDVATKQNSYDPKVLTSPQEVNGRVRQANGVITGAGEESGSTVQLVKLPKGARILPSSFLDFEAGQNASLTVKVGDSGDDDRYLAAVAPGASAARVLLDALKLAPYTLTDESWISLVTGGSQVLTADKKIGFCIFYVID